MKMQKVEFIALSVYLLQLHQVVSDGIQAVRREAKRFGAAGN
jgi:hypothetical protein